MTDADVSLTLRSRLAAVEERLCAACTRSGRPRSAVTLVAVTKTVSPEVAALLPGLGVHDLGESRPQELWRKAGAIPSAPWHFVGHLQRNKIERTLPLVQVIHAVDSVRLLTALDDASEGRVPPRVLLEVNASCEANKQGFSPEEVLAIVPTIAALENLRVTGLMTMAAFEPNPQHCRPTFVLLRELRDRLQTELGQAMPELSMGMTNDYEVAVEEGATLVRLGTALFDGIGR